MYAHEEGADIIKITNISASTSQHIQYMKTDFERDSKRAYQVNAAVNNLEPLRHFHTLNNSAVSNWLLALANDVKSPRDTPDRTNDRRAEYLNGFDSSEHRNGLRQLIRIYEELRKNADSVDEERSFYKMLITNSIQYIAEPWLRERFAEAYQINIADIAVVVRQGVAWNEIEINVHLPVGYNDYNDESGKLRHHSVNRSDQLILAMGGAFSMTFIRLELREDLSKGAHVQQTWTFGLINK